MYEFKLAFKYLIPKKKSLSTALISLISVFVISIVVWLVVVFLSVTTGIEKNWLNKLTSLNAPIRIAPTKEYFSSYYYLVDSISSDSNYTSKNIQEKFLSNTDPYDPEIDMEPPSFWPKPILDNNNLLLDPVKKAYEILETSKSTHPSLAFQDYEISGALMRLSLNHYNKTNFLTQMSYLLSFNDKNPKLQSLLMPPNHNDINHLIDQVDKSYDHVQKDMPSNYANIDLSTIRLKSIFDNIEINKIRLEKPYLIYSDLLPLENNLPAYAHIQDNIVKYLSISNEKRDNLLNGKIIYENNISYFSYKNKSYPISPIAVIQLGETPIYETNFDIKQLDEIISLNDLNFTIKKDIGKNSIFAQIPLKDLSIYDFKTKDSNSDPFWVYQKGSQSILPTKIEGSGVLLPKNYQNSGVLIGDKGYFSYAAITPTSTQEQRVPIYVAGFYDPGVMPIGNKCILVDSSITNIINASSKTFSPDGTPMNGIYVWIDDMKKTDSIRKDLQDKFEQEGIASFFDISTYKDFEFSKDLLQQFQSDKLLFSLIALIIMIVACSNIISMLVLLVNDKKKEIAILQSMGASKKSIAFIFGFCGAMLGMLSSLIGVSTAILTLRHLDVIVKFLSMIQGHAAFNAAFFGQTLPNTLSYEALMFVLILTPILSIVAGLIPAIKASRLKISPILRSE